MSVLRKLILSAALVLGVTPAFGAFPSSPSEQLRVFATCAGRLSALEEHQRLFDGPASEKTAAQKRLFDDVISALIDDAVAYGMPRPQALNWQVQAKMAHAMLRQQATFGTSPSRADAAERVLRVEIAACDGLLLGA